MGVGIKMGVKGHPTDPAFGTGVLGNVHITSNTSASSLVSYADDTGVIRLDCDNFIVDSGVSLTADKRNAGMIIRCRKKCIINGSIVNKLATRSLARIINSVLVDQSAYLAEYYPAWMILNGTGGKGGDGFSGGYQSREGYGQVGRFYGGGYSGGGGGFRAWYDPYPRNGWDTWAGYGGHATDIRIDTSMFVGGARGSESRSSGGDGAYGGGGGGGTYSTSNYWGGYGGSGPGGWGTDGRTYNQGGNLTYGSGAGGGAGTIGGGVIIIYCNGFMSITGSIDCSGNQGGAGGCTSVSNGGYYRQAAGGGGGGGGRIFIVHKKPYNSLDLTGIFNVAGGLGGYSYSTNMLANSGNPGDKKHIEFRDYLNGSIAPSDLP